MIAGVPERRYARADRRTAALAIPDAVSFAMENVTPCYLSEPRSDTPERLVTTPTETRPPRPIADRSFS
jgi:hypothetical protein